MAAPGSPGQEEAVPADPYNRQGLAWQLLGALRAACSLALLVTAQIFLALGIKGLCLCPDPAGLTLRVPCALPRASWGSSSEEQGAAFCAKLILPVLPYSDVPAPFL